LHPTKLIFTTVQRENIVILVIHRKGYRYREVRKVTYSRSLNLEMMEPRFFLSDPCMLNSYAAFAIKLPAILKDNQPIFQTKVKIKPEKFQGQFAIRFLLGF
jgi:hypothetical protein